MTGPSSVPPASPTPPGSPPPPAPSPRSARRDILLFTLVVVLAFVVGVAAINATLNWRRAGARVANASAGPSSGSTAVELQPFAAQIGRLLEALDYIGAPLSAADRQAVDAALRRTDDEQGATTEAQRILDRYTLFDVHINPESRVRVTAGAAPRELVQHGWRTFLVKVTNEAGVTAALKVASPQAQRVYARGPDGFSMDPRPPQRVTPRDVADRWLDVAMYDKPPLTPTLSGLEVEYRIVQLYSRDTGKRDATVSFDVGQGTQDIGFRNDASLLFTCLPARDVVLRVLDEHGQPSTASFVITDAQGHVYPSPAKRLAPDFGFHPQVYRSDGERVTLGAGEYTVEFTRGPEYVVQRQPLRVDAAPSSDGATPLEATFKLQRWIDLPRMGWYSGDHHVHAAGCMHYESPTEGVSPQDMIRHVLGEGLNVASILTWGPSYYFQKQFFEGKDHALSTRDQLMHYDIEVSGFPSSHAGHLVLLRLKDQNYPKTKVLDDWPTWNLPILQWAKAQGAVVGYAHSGWGLEVESTDIPTREVPKFDGIGANEYIVDVAHDAVDFISTIDTPAPWELNIWYHTLNVGFRTRISGETDFPCIYGDRVGLGRSYVKLDEGLSYDRWVDGIHAGRTYVTDGKSHLLDFQVNGRGAGVGASEVPLDAPGTVRVTARVAARLPEAPSQTVMVSMGSELLARPGRNLRTHPFSQKPYWDLERARIGDTRDVPIEVIVNGQSVARRTVTADGAVQDVAFDVPIERSSWVALRILASSHTNPVFVLVGGKPVRASRASAEWCLAGVDRCWSQKMPQIAARERGAAQRAYDRARQVYRQRLAESPQ